MIASGFGARTPSAMQNSFASWWLCHWVYRAGQVHKQLRAEEYLKTIPNVHLLALTAEGPNRLADHDAVLIMYDHWGKQTEEFKELALSAEPFSRALGAWTGSRRIFSTNQGHLGLEYEVLEEGDVVWVTPKAHVPFILRKISNTDGELRHRFTRAMLCSWDHER
jgi:hypothetical protein